MPCFGSRSLSVIVGTSSSRGLDPVRSVNFRSEELTTVCASSTYIFAVSSDTSATKNGANVVRGRCVL